MSKPLKKGGEGGFDTPMKKTTQPTSSRQGASFAQADAAGRFLAVIPARGGSTGLPGKNRMKLRGISLVARAVLIARQIPEIRWIQVSTDDDAIAGEAEQAGVEVPFRRPPELSGGEVPMVEVLRHVAGWFQAHVGERCEGLVLLQPTSPMRKLKDVQGALSLFREARKTDPRVAAVHTVSRVPEPYMPGNLRRLSRDRDGLWRIGEGPAFGNGKPGRSNRFDTGPVYYRTGAAVVLDMDRLDALTLNRGLVLPYFLDRPLVSIDSLYDLLRIEHFEGSLEPPFETGDSAERRSADGSERK